MSEIETPIKTVRVGAVGRPISIPIDSELEGVGPPRPTEVVSEVEPRVALIIGKTRFRFQAGIVRHEIEELLGHDIGGIRRWEELSERKAQLRPIDGVKVVRGGASEEVADVPVLLLAHHPDVELIDHCRTDNTRPGKQYRVCRLGVMVFEDREVRGIPEDSAPVGSRVHPPSGTSQGKSILVRGVIVEFERLEVPGDIAVVLPLIIVRKARITQVGQGHEIEQELTLLVNPVGTNDIAEERLMRRRVYDGYGLGRGGTGEDGLREITAALRRCGDRHAIS